MTLPPHFAGFPHNESREPDPLLVACLIGIFIALLVLISTASCSSVQQIDGVAKTDTWGRHHGRFLVGPRVTWASGVQAELLAGRQCPLWEPGEPHYSRRAPPEEWQAQIEVSIPLWTR